MKTTFTVILLLISLTSCSLLTKSGRQARAYRNYVRKSSVVRAKQQKKFHFRVPQMAIRQDSPMITTAPEYPQSMTAAHSSGSDSFAPASPEQTAPVEQTSPQN